LKKRNPSLEHFQSKNLFVTLSKNFERDLEVCKEEIKVWCPVARQAIELIYYDRERELGFSFENNRHEEYNKKM
jgi:hypothetical protein